MIMVKILMENILSLRLMGFICSMFSRCVARAVSVISI